MSWLKADDFEVPDCRNDNLRVNATCIGTLRATNTSIIVHHASTINSVAITGQAVVHGSLIFDENAELRFVDVPLSNVDVTGDKGNVLLYVTQSLVVKARTELLIELNVDDTIEVERHDRRCVWQVRAGRLTRRQAHLFRARLVFRNGSTRALQSELLVNKRKATPMFFSSLLLSLK